MLNISLGFKTPNEVGVLYLDKELHIGYINFCNRFLDSPLPLSPFCLPIQKDLVKAKRSIFEGLHGVFNDSLPDGWGRKLLKCYLHQQNIDETQLTPLNRLAYVGEQGMGALTYMPSINSYCIENTSLDLDELCNQANALFYQDKNIPSNILSLLQASQHGIGGVRPKMMIGMSEDRTQIITDVQTKLPAGFEQWIVKFVSNNDSKESGKEEYAYSLLARHAGLTMEDTHLLETAKNSYFATRRFDRNGNNVHVHTLSGLLNVDHRIPSLDYRHLVTVSNKLTKDMDSTKECFRRMLFNIYTGNRDDHCKNHAFMMNAQGLWRPTPVYDITYSDGVNGEHNMTVAGAGKNISKESILLVAQDANINKRNAEEMMEQMRESVSHWSQSAAIAGLSKRTTQRIGGVIDNLLSSGSPNRKP
jgi:serine/threonine-protein kinase HipA